jgi:endonuclease III-like uncharacterized protein
MVNSSQIKEIRSMKKHLNFSHHCIAQILGVSVEEVISSLKPFSNYPIKKIVKPEKIHEEHQIMLDAGLEDKYIVIELARWYGVGPKTLQSIVTFVTYKNIAKERVDSHP